MKLKTSLPAHLLVSVLVFVNLACYSQSIEGDWYSKLEVQGITLRLNLHVKSGSGSYISTWDSPDQGANAIPATSTSFTYPDFSFSDDQSEIKFTGKVDPGFSEIKGKFSQGTMVKDLTFRRTPFSASPGSIEDLKLKYNKKEVYITMRDGVKLFTSIYTPKDSSVNHPVLLNRTPYDIEPGGPDNFNFFMQVYSRYALDNYIMVFQDVRGRYMSEGSFEDIRPVIPLRKSSKDTDESTDTYDSVDWLVKNVRGNNGNVGIFGISYPGFYSTMGIIAAHPAIKAVSPQAPVTAWFLGDDFHHNGAFFLLDCFGFYFGFGHPFKTPSRRGFPFFNWPVPDSYDFLLAAGSDKSITNKYMGDSIKFWNDAFSHPDYDQFWKARDPRQYLKNVKPAVMTVGGWFDAEDLYGTLHTYSAIEKQNSPAVKNTLVMGPWYHSQWAFGKAENVGNIYWGMDANASFHELEKKFFDFYLKGEGDGNFPEATIFITGKNEWTTFDTWPPKNTENRSIYLQPSGKAAFSAPDQDGGFDEYVSDPMKPVPYTPEIEAERTRAYMTDDQRFTDRRPDVMVYRTDVLKEDLTLTGPLTADLFVSTTGTDADFIVKLIDILPDDAKRPAGADLKVPYGGYEMLVRAEVFRGRYRNSFEKPEAFVPGKITEVKYELPDIAHTFKKGHRMMIQVQNSWFPLVDRNPQKFIDIYTCNDNDFQKASMRIYHDQKNPSHLVVNVLK